MMDTQAAGTRPAEERDVYTHKPISTRAKLYKFR